MKSKLFSLLALTGCFAFILCGCATTSSTETPAASTPSPAATATSGTTDQTGTHSVDVKAPETGNGVINNTSNPGTTNAAKMISPALP